MAVTRTVASTVAPNSQAEAYNGFGMAPVGTVVAWIPGCYTTGANTGYARQLGSSDDTAGANPYALAFGWYVCNGADLGSDLDELQDSISPIFSGANRYLPNLSNDRFLNGSTACIGGQGGQNTADDHRHNFSLTAGAQSYAGSPTITGGILESVSHNHSHIGFNNATAMGNSALLVSADINKGGPFPNSISSDGSHAHLVLGMTINNAHTHPSFNIVGVGAGPYYIGSAAGPVGSFENRPNYLKCFFIMRVK